MVDPFDRRDVLGLRRLPLKGHGFGEETARIVKVQLAVSPRSEGDFFHLILNFLRLPSDLHPKTGFDLEDCFSVLDRDGSRMRHSGLHKLKLTAVDFQCDLAQSSDYARIFAFFNWEVAISFPNPLKVKGWTTTKDQKAKGSGGYTS